MIDEETIRPLREKYATDSRETDKSVKLNGNYYQNDHGSKYKKNGLTASGKIKASENLSLQAFHKCETELLQSMKYAKLIL
jgi:hypothetical protein